MSEFQAVALSAEQQHAIAEIVGYTRGKYFGYRDNGNTILGPRGQELDAPRPPRIPVEWFADEPAPDFDDLVRPLSSRSVLDERLEIVARIKGGFKNAEVEVTVARIGDKRNTHTFKWSQAQDGRPEEWKQIHTSRFLSESDIQAVAERQLRAIDVYPRATEKRSHTSIALHGLETHKFDLCNGNTEKHPEITVTLKGDSARIGFLFGKEFVAPDPKLLRVPEDWVEKLGIEKARRLHLAAAHSRSATELPEEFNVPIGTPINDSIWAKKVAAIAEVVLHAAGSEFESVRPRHLIASTEALRATA